MGVPDLPVGTLSHLFTDLEGSTTLWEEHPEAMKAALARHDEILDAAIEANRGHVVKRTGDGIYAVFTSALDAVVAAAAALRTLDAEPWGATGPLSVRMGIHTGTAEQRAGDYFGPVPNRAARLMAAAHGGQLVLSEFSASLVREHLLVGLGLLDLGEHRLSGLAKPEHAYQLTIDGLRSQFPPLRSLDAFPVAILASTGSAFASDDTEFAGREPELAALERAWGDARAGRLRVALVGGEPGIGKTRLTAELARRVGAQGGIALYGRCDEEAAVPYQPFVEALRDYVAACPSSVLHERLHGLEADLARVFPELSGRLPAPPPLSTGDPETERYRVFEAITRLVGGISSSQPAVLILDDIHWADRPTLLLFRHLVRSALGAALLVIACYRDVDAPRDAPIGDLLADLHRERFVKRVPLSGLSVAEAGEVLGSVAGHPVAPTLATALHRETNGNPFFLEELLRHLMETRAVELDAASSPDVDLSTLDLPESVRDVVERRLRGMSNAVNVALGVAAVIGPEFDAGLVAAGGGLAVEEVLDSLDQATAARLVVEYRDRIGRYAFAHALIRQTVYAALGTAQRTQLHASVGAAIETSHASERTAATLAHHFTRAIPLVDAGKAIDYTTRAGHEAVDDVAFEEAVEHFERALELVDAHAAGETALRSDLLTDLASALVYVDERAGVRAALDAVNEARAHGTPEQFGRAVAVFVEPTYAGEGFPTHISPLVDEARARLGSEHPTLQARLLAFEAFKYAAYQLYGRDGTGLAEEAVRLARVSGDPIALTDGLFSLAANLEGRECVGERLDLGTELVALGPRAGGRASAFGLRVLAGAHLAFGDADELTRAIHGLATVGDELRWAPAHVYAAQWRGTQALLEGRFDDVRRVGDELRRRARAYRGAAGMRMHQGFYLDREQGTLPAMTGTAPDDLLDTAYNTASLALAYLETDDVAGAVHLLEHAAASGFHADNHESGLPGALAMLAEVAVAAERSVEAARLRELLSPFSGLLLAGVLGIACLGAADRYLAMLSATLGRWDEAEAAFGRALELEARIRGHALVPRTRYWQARHLRSRGRAGDDRAARRLLDDVVADAARLGMDRLRRQAEELRAA